MQKKNNRILYGENAKQSKITEKTARKICEMLSEGNRVCEIVNTLGVSKNIVRHIKDGDSWSHISSQYNISNYKNNRLTANDIDVIINLLKQNKTYEEIRKLTGCSKSSIYYIKDNYYKTRTKKTIRSKTRIDAMIFKLYNENVSIDDISELTGHTKKYILDTITHFKS